MRCWVYYILLAAKYPVPVTNGFDWRLAWVGTCELALSAAHDRLDDDDAIAAVEPYSFSVMNGLRVLIGREMRNTHVPSVDRDDGSEASAMRAVYDGLAAMWSREVENLPLGWQPFANELGFGPEDEVDPCREQGTTRVENAFTVCDSVSAHQPLRPD